MVVTGTATTTGSPAVTLAARSFATAPSAGAESSSPAYARLSPARRGRDRAWSWSTRSPEAGPLCPQEAPTPPGLPPASSAPWGSLVPRPRSTPGPTCAPARLPAAFREERWEPDQQRAPGHCEMRAGRGPPSSQSHSRNNTSAAETPTEITKKSMLPGVFSSHRQRPEAGKTEKTTEHPTWREVALLDAGYLNAHFTRSLLSNLQLMISTSTQAVSS